jgi:hypothetical protein
MRTYDGFSIDDGREGYCMRRIAGLSAVSMFMLGLLMGDVRCETFEQSNRKWVFDRLEALKNGQPDVVRFMLRRIGCNLVNPAPLVTQISNCTQQRPSFVCEMTVEMHVDGMGDSPFYEHCSSNGR